MTPKGRMADTDKREKWRIDMKFDEALRFLVKGSAKQKTPKATKKTPRVKNGGENQE